MCVPACVHVHVHVCMCAHTCQGKGVEVRTTHWELVFFGSWVSNSVHHG